MEESDIIMKVISVITSGGGFIKVHRTDFEPKLVYLTNGRTVGTTNTPRIIIKRPCTEKEDHFINVPRNEIASTCKLVK